MCLRTESEVVTEDAGKAKNLQRAFFPSLPSLNEATHGKIDKVGVIARPPK